MHVDSNSIVISPVAGHAKPSFEYIDCLRGYAILAVLACHTAMQFPELPWRFKQLVASGWHGVQLFFLASMITLLMSVKWECSRKGYVNWRQFYIRRFFRIAPAFYLAALIYTLLGWNRNATAVGSAGFFAFATAWIPQNLGQDLVPGAWSVSVEFSIYLVFPLVATYCQGVIRATLLLIGSIWLASFANQVTVECFSATLPPERLDNYVYFSFFNQLPIFALANLFYELFNRKLALEDSLSVGGLSRVRLWLVVSLAMLAVAAYLALPRSFGSLRFVPPNFFVSAIWMCIFIYGLADRNKTILTNAYIAKLGQVSFSAYLWHWIVYSSLCHTHWGELMRNQSRWAALACYSLMLGLVLVITYIVAYVSYRLVEQPGIALSRVVAARTDAWFKARQSTSQALANIAE